jgi:transposase
MGRGRGATKVMSTQPTQSLQSQPAPLPAPELDNTPDDARPTDVQVIRPYGVGIDTHSKFIQVCVMYQFKQPGGQVLVRQQEKEFKTHWVDLVNAKRWVMHVLGKHAEESTLRYCIESTGTYHLPVLKAWGGIPSVVNPLLAGASHRKTDVLDARTLAHHSITGLWKASFIPSEQAQVLRVIWARRREMARRATRAANQLNNIVLRFGFTFGADVSMRSIQGESILSDLIDGQVVDVDGAPPEGLPLEVRPVISALLKDLRSDLKEAHAAVEACEEYIKSRDWPIGEGTLPGGKLLGHLRTVPGVGETTALTWLAEITDPRRFQNSKQVAAFSGCDPSVKVSAGKITSYVRRQGNLRLHQSLLYAASGLMRRRDDPLGNWGRAIAGRHKKGGYKKACGAIARRLACALWEVHRRGEPFSYIQYTLAQMIECPLTPLGLIVAPRAVKVLRDAGIRNSHQLAAAYAAGKLAAINGFGESSIDLVKQWVAKEGKRVRSAEAQFPEAGASGKTQAKTYSLEPGLVFQKKGANRKDSNEQNLQTNPNDVPGTPAEAAASARALGRRSGRAGRKRAGGSAATPHGGHA